MDQFGRFGQDQPVHIVEIQLLGYQLPNLNGAAAYWAINGNY
jgi:hypothetical protein